MSVVIAKFVFSEDYAPEHKTETYSTEVYCPFCRDSIGVLEVQCEWYQPVIEFEEEDVECEEVGDFFACPHTESYEFLIDSFRTNGSVAVFVFQSEETPTEESLSELAEYSAEYEVLSGDASPDEIQTIFNRMLWGK